MLDADAITDIRQLAWQYSYRPMPQIGAWEDAAREFLVHCLEADNAGVGIMRQASWRRRALRNSVTEHRRNSHNYMKDAANELACIMALEDLPPWLREVPLSGSTYAEAYAALSDALDEGVEHMRGCIWTDATRGYFHQMAYCMRAWLSAREKLL
jgi:hypothetical protein